MSDEATIRLLRLCPKGLSEQTLPVGALGNETAGSYAAAVWRILTDVRRLELEAAAAAAATAAAAAVSGATASRADESPIPCLCHFYGMPGNYCTNCLGSP